MQKWWFSLPAQTIIQLVTLALLSAMVFISTGCSTLLPGSVPGDNSVLPVSDSADMPQAIQNLVATADRQYLNSQLNESLATLERAIRIKPRQAEVWSRMAKVSSMLDNHAQAAQYARRSNSYIRNNSQLRQFNDALIESATAGIRFE